MQKRMVELKSKGGISQLSQLDLEIEALSAEIKHNLQHLQKPFIKLQSLALHGEGSGLTPEEINKLNQYLNNPMEALSAEEAGYPLLRQILQKLAQAMASGKLKLKPDKLRKAEQAISNIFDKNSLAGLHQKCVDIMLQKKQLSASAEVAETRSGLLKLQESLEKLEQKKRALESEESVLEQTFNATLEKIRSHKNQIEKNIFDFSGRKVSIQ
jgi:chromosome segregation ATPase